MKNEKQVSGHGTRTQSKAKDVLSLSQLEAILSGEIVRIQSAYDAYDNSPPPPNVQHPRVQAAHDYQFRCEHAKMLIKLADQRLKLEAARILRNGAAASTEGGAL